MLDSLARHFDKLPEYYNYVEVVLWPTLGLLVGGVGLRRSGATRRRCFLAAGTLGVFGASDGFEAANGNEWWHPWWLLLWKVTCVGVLALLLALAWRDRRRARGRPAVPEPRPVQPPSREGSAIMRPGGGRRGE